MLALVTTRPLSNFMDHVSYVETVRCRLRLRARGLELAGSKCQLTSDDLVGLNLKLMTGAAGRQVLAEYLEMLQCPPDSAYWPACVSLQDMAPLLVIGLCDSFRRLVLPYQCLQYQVLQVVDFDDDRAAFKHMIQLAKTHNTCPACQDPYFSKVLMDYIFGRDTAPLVQLQRMKKVKAALRDLIMELPSSSVEVERQHANQLVEAKGSAKRATTLQHSSYISSVRLEHSAVFSAVEEEVLGQKKTMVRRLLKRRRIDTPGAAGLSLKRGRNQMTKAGTVKRRPGLLKGLL